MAKKPSSRKPIRSSTKLPPSQLPDILTDALRDLIPWLESEGIPSALIGGVAVAFVGKPRITQDIDAVAWLDVDRVESLLDAGKAYGFLPRFDDSARFARSRRVLLVEHTRSGVTVDLSCGALPFESELIARARTIVVGSLRLKVATPEDLVVMKAIARRPRDIADIEGILDIEQNLDLKRIRYWVKQFAEVLEMPELIDDLEKLLQACSRQID